MTEFAVITGLSGAGRTTAAAVLEDQGWFVIDNLPVALVPKVAELALQPGSGIDRVALAVGTSNDDEQLTGMFEELRRDGSRVRVLFLDARSEVLVRRYESTRRRHPVGVADMLGDAIEKERSRLDHLRSVADVVIDTSDLNVHELRARVEEIFDDEHEDLGMQVRVMSFGYKHGLPADVDLVLDCRLLPNPHWQEELRPFTGHDPDVRRFVIESNLAQDFLSRLEDLLAVALPAYESEGKAYLTVAFGCTGGRHRSVAITEEVAKRLRSHGLRPGVIHRDVTKGA